MHSDWLKEVRRFGTSNECGKFQQNIAMQIYNLLMTSDTCLHESDFVLGEILDQG